MAGIGQMGDTARRAGDTVSIEPLGVRFTVPALWMGRFPPGTTPSKPGTGRFGCQLMINGPPEDRIVVDPARFPLITQRLVGERRSYQEALDAVVPVSAMVARAGGDRFDSSCIAPQVNFYVTDSASARSSDLMAIIAESIVGRNYSGVHSVTSDSAGWRAVHLSWSEHQSDFIRPATLEIWSRSIGNRFLIVGVMDSWSDPLDIADLLASLQWRTSP
ncbi:MAG TPA: hypothetical protein VGM20_12910 [Gemmatimonadales bacterium]|jgi:hypothetical protein